MPPTGRSGAGSSSTPRPVPAEQAVDGLGRLRGQELPARVGPEVLGRARDVERPRGDEREQLVLVHGQRVLAPGVLAVARRRTSAGRRS